MSSRHGSALYLGAPTIRGMLRLIVSRESRLASTELDRLRFRTAKGSSPKETPRTMPEARCPALSPDKGGDDQGVDDVDEEAAHQRHDDEGAVGGAVLLGDRCHVGNGGGC